MTRPAPPPARLLRERDVLLRLAVAAARLRRLHKALDEMEEARVAVADEIGVRSLTPMAMMSAAYNTALADFDRALLEAADLYTLADPETYDLLRQTT